MAYPLTLHDHHNSDCSVTIIIQTDASGTLGCGAVFGNLWLQWKWPSEWQPLSIMAKELVPIVCSCAVWGPKLAQKPVLFQCDNLSLVTALNKGTCKDKLVMQLLRILTFLLLTLTYTLHPPTLQGPLMYQPTIYHDLKCLLIFL